MLEWVANWPEWAQSFWFMYVTFHDLVQWAVLFVIGLTAYGQRQKKKDLE